MKVVSSDIQKFYVTISYHGGQKQPDGFDEILEAKNKLRTQWKRNVIQNVITSHRRMFCKMILNSLNILSEVS